MAARVVLTGSRAGLAVLLTLLTVLTVLAAAGALSEEPAVVFEAGRNCSGPGCEAASLDDDEPPCPPDSAPMPTAAAPAANDSGGAAVQCACAPGRCVQPVCRPASHVVLKQRGSGVPGDCCDVYECVPPRERNCSEVVCPTEPALCPPDSFRLPSHKGPRDCCSVPQGCRCLPRPCPDPECAAGLEPRPLRPGNGLPGTCCPSYECVDPARPPPGLAAALTAEDSAPSAPAAASGGLPLLKLLLPPPAEAEAEGGRCLTSAGRPMGSGQLWQDDPCTTCVCRNGTKRCEAFMCEARCPSPRLRPGDCCPVCDEWPAGCPAANCSQSCPHGFEADGRGCNSCLCKPGSEHQTGASCHLDCPGGFLLDRLGQRLCRCAPPQPGDCAPLRGCAKNCSHGYRLNKAGCEVCRCAQCRPLRRPADCAKTCAHGLRTNDRGCLICKCRASPEQPASPGRPVSFTLCKNSEGEHEDGETWFDGCRQCYCHGGTEMCNLIACPALSCRDPVFDSSHSCCPRCPDDAADPGPEPEPEPPQAMVCQSVDGSYRVEGETWRLDACTSCLCHAGRALCETPQCPPTPCARPTRRPGACCAECPLTSLAPQRAARACAHREHGATWREPGSCSSCLCQDGRHVCFGERCADAACARPVLVKNQCCPICLLGGAAAAAAGAEPCRGADNATTYQEGEAWLEKPCSRCSCVRGQRECVPCCPACADPTDIQPSGLLDEWKYLLIIALLLVVVMFLVVFLLCQWHRNRQIKLDISPKSCPNPAYSGYSHRSSFPPPRYTSTDRQSKCEPYQYEIVPPYDSVDLLKSPSFGASEKAALAPV